MHRNTAVASPRKLASWRRSAVLGGILTLLLALVPAAGVSAQDGAAEPRPIDAFCPEGQTPSAGYPDTAGNEHELAIDCVSAYGIAQGKADGRYAPRELVSRAQMASFVVRLLELFAEPYGYQIPQDPENRFSDVDPESEHGRAINQLAELGVVSGHPDGTYRPLNKVRRDQMATFINNAIGVALGAPLMSDQDSFDDDNGNEHEDNINGIASVGIAVGDGEGNYSPARRVPRDQMASFLARSGDFLQVNAFTSEFFVLLSGYAEVDDSGDSPVFGAGNRDMFGFALLGLNSETDRACVTLFFVEGNDSPFTGFHVHQAAMDANGPIVIGLPTPDESGFVDGCVDADAATVDEVEDAPSGFYLNLHTDQFPAGAARGQLDVTVMPTYMSWAHEVDDSGDQPVFGQGEPDASGISYLQLDPATGRICSFVTTDATGPFTGMHIHRGGMPENGPIVVEFAPPDDATGEVSQCLDAGTQQVEEFITNRDAYYLNVHTQDFPAGVIRAQLDSFTLVVPLSGENEVDDEGNRGAGEPGATGTSYIQVTFFSQQQLCHLTMTDATGPFVGMHIHEGAPDENGPIVLGLTPPDDTTGEVSECVDLPDELLFIDLAFHYLNIHTEDFPGGAVRGQLDEGIVF